MSDERTIVVAIEGLASLFPSQQSLDGSLSIFSMRGRYQLHWFPYRSRYRRSVELIQHTESDFAVDDWDNCGAFTVDFQDLTGLRFDPGNWRIVINRLKSSIVRVFQFNEKHFFAIMVFVQSVFRWGVGVPGSQEFAVEFYRVGPGDRYFRPMHLKMSDCSFSTFSDLWRSCMKCYERLICDLDRYRWLVSASYPLAEAACGVHGGLLRDIAEFAAGFPVFCRISASEWPSLFEADSGRLIDPDGIRKRLYFAGVETSALHAILPFLFGVYPFSSTAAERVAIDTACQRNFAAVQLQSESQLPGQIERNSRAANFLTVMTGDVSRTDRTHPLFREDDGPGLAVLRRILAFYIFGDPAVGYLQGMSDLVVPIVIAFERADGDWGAKLPRIYSLFSEMLVHIGHRRFLTKISTESDGDLRECARIIEEVSPLLAILLRRAGLADFQWLLTEYILVFKRSFVDVWEVWARLHTAPEPAVWLRYFIAALVLRAFPELVAVKDMCVATVKEMMPGILRRMDLKEVAVTALWLYEKVKPVSSIAFEQDGRGSPPEFMEFAD
jgi:hypothetical protein